MQPGSVSEKIDYSKFERKRPDSPRKGREEEESFRWSSVGLSGNPIQVIRDHCRRKDESPKKTKKATSFHTPADPTELMKERIESVMNLTNGVAKPIKILNKGIEQGVGLVCNSTQASQKVCSAVGSGIQTAIDQIPQSWRDGTSEFLDRTSDEFGSLIERRYNISKEKSSEFLDSTGVLFGVVGLGAAIKTGQTMTKAAVKVKKATGATKKIDYSFAGYMESAKDFAHPPREFHGALKKDLYVVQYHNNGVLHQERSLRWFMPTEEANNLKTVQEILDRYAILSKYGDRTHVSIAKIPVGEQVRYLHGKAGSKVDLFNFEFRRGGGIQYRFAEFKPEWIVETRALPSRSKPIRGGIIKKEFVPPLVVAPLLGSTHRSEASEQQLNETAKKSLKEFTQKINEGIGFITTSNRDHMQLERNRLPNWEQKAAELRAQRQQNYVNMRQNVEAAGQGMASAFALLGKPRIAQQVETFAKGAMSLLECGSLFTTGTAMTASTAASGPLLAASFSPLMPYVALVSAAAAFASLRKPKRSEDGLGTFLVQMRDSILDEIAGFRNEVRERFTEISTKIDRQTAHMDHGFFTLRRQVNDFKVPVLYSLERIETDLRMLQTINIKLDFLILSDFIEACVFIQNYKVRFGPLKEISKENFIRLAQTLENYLLGEKPYYYYVNGSLYQDYSAQGVNKFLHSIQPEALFGYLGRYAQQELGITFPATIRIKDLPNPMILALGLQRYLPLRSKAAHIHYDPERIRLSKLRPEFEHTLEFVRNIKTNKALFEKLFANHKANEEKVLAFCKKEIEKVNEALHKEVKAKAEKLSEEALKTMQGPDTNHGNIFIKGCRSGLRNYNAVLVTFYNEVEKALKETRKKYLETFDQFKLDISCPGTTLATTVSKLPLAYFVIPEDKQKTNFRFGPLDLTKLNCRNSTLASDITVWAYLAERLKIGHIHSVYSVNVEDYSVEKDNLGNVEFKIKVNFIQPNPREPNSQQSLPLIEKQHKSSSNDPRQTLPSTITSDGEYGGNIGDMSQFIKQIRGVFLHDRGGLMVHHAWQNAGIMSPALPAGGNESMRLISGLVNSSLVEYRRKAIAELYKENTALAIEFQRALDELDKSYNLLQHFGYIGGKNREKLESLLNGKKIREYHDNYLNHNSVTESAPFFPTSMLALVSQQIVSEFTPGRTLSTAPLEEMLQIQLAQICYCENQVKNAISIESHTKNTGNQMDSSIKEIFEQMRQENEGLVQANSELHDRVTLLNDTVIDLHEQMANMNAIMEQQRKEQKEQMDRMFLMMQQMQHLLLSRTSSS